MNVLVVDDTEINRKLLCAILESAGHRSLEASDGLQAMDVLARENVDAVISDLLMPNMDGFNLCNEMRRSERFCTIPFIAYSSTYTSSDDMRLARSLGADRYLIKPAPQEAILKALREAVAKSNVRQAIPQESAFTETGIHKAYSVAMVGKLEEKIAELKQSVADLESAHAQISELNANLERHVRERTVELERANQNLARRNEEIQNFYHALSHELKTPLTAAREFISIVLDGLAGPLNAKQDDFLRISLESCEQLRIYIDDLLDAARLETGKLQLQLQPSSLAAVVEQSIAALQPLAEEKSIHLCCVSERLPQALADPKRLVQIITNLVNNALKFTPSGGRISVNVAADRTDPRFQCVAVADTGIGIAADQLDRIFDRLYQVKTNAVSSCQSLGLGLYICRELTTLHGGTISVQSAPGKGSTFTFTVPVAPAQPLSSPPLGAPS